MNVHFLGGSAYSTAGGIQTFNRTLLRCLHGCGWLAEGYLTNDDLSDVPAVLRTRLRGGGGSKVGLARWVMAHGFRGCDVFLTDHLNYSPILAAHLGSGLKVVTLHAYEMQIPVAFYRRSAFPAIDAFICVSEYSRSLAIQAGLPESKLYVCPHGLDIGVEKGREDSTEASDGNVPVILFVGRLDRHYKGHGHLITAASILKSKGVRFRLRFAGGGTRLEEFRQMTRKKKVEDCVEFLGYVEDAALDCLYDEADIFALPSSGEGFGLVYLEAMARGLPCLASIEGAAPEVVIDGETGTCVPYGDVQGIAEALQRWIESPDERRRLGRKGRERYRSRFTVEAFEQRLVRLLEEIRENG